MVFYKPNNSFFLASTSSSLIIPFSFRSWNLANSSAVDSFAAWG